MTKNKILSFLDTYFRYNQIQMDPEDCKKTSFITNYAIYCNNTMPCGLKNIGQHTKGW
ncbi:hypothetical protein T459_30012 [Capsicum annuum]|uniref:Uncharacterized protein n=1 Tax=Capsicum annuum TaxID=4072 RepID=A0A2G2Y753_CAPAN|nr:hypothetical protein T459_30012 [Capsicum annuum]